METVLASENVRPKSIRVAVLYFAANVALMIFTLSLAIRLIPASAIADAIVHVAVTGYIVAQLYKLKAWAVYAYCVVQIFGFVQCFSFASMPFIAFATLVGNVAMAYWVYSSTAKIRESFDNAMLERYRKI